jgi:hypothetical protein
MSNEYILNPIPHEWGYVSEDNHWMAVPFDTGYMVIKDDQQIKSFKFLKAATKYIQAQIGEEKDSKPKKVSKAKTLEDFM